MSEKQPNGTVGDFDDFQRKYTIRESEATATGNPMLLETFGRDHLVVETYDNDQIWTLIEEDGGQFLIPGYHFVNRIAYLITEESWYDADEVYLY